MSSTDQTRNVTAAGNESIGIGGDVSGSKVVSGSGHLLVDGDLMISHPDWGRLGEAIREVVQELKVGIDGQRESTKVELKSDIPDLLPYLCDRSEQEKELRDKLRHHL